jgi:hypothetical protein
MPREANANAFRDRLTDALERISLCAEAGLSRLLADRISHMIMIDSIQRSTSQTWLP